MIMGKLFCLMGKSGAGKDTILKRLLADRELNLIPVIPYTTRPKRSREADGVEYHFIDEAALQQYERAGAIIEKRAYKTVNGVWYYCTIDDGRIDLHSGNYILIGTLETYQKLKDFFGEDKIVPIYITVDDGVRLERALHREKQQLKPNYEELCRRFLADNIDYHEDRLKVCQIKKRYVNLDLEKCLSEIKHDLLKEIKG